MKLPYAVNFAPASPPAPLYHIFQFKNFVLFENVTLSYTLVLGFTIVAFIMNTPANDAFIALRNVEYVDMSVFAGIVNVLPKPSMHEP